MSEKFTVPSTNVDKLTLEYLMNRSQYKKYIEKTDPEKYYENETHLNKVYKYKRKILEITEELLNNPELLITLDVNESFGNYSRTLIRYFELKELENDDNDMLFDNMDKEDCRLQEDVDYKYSKRDYKNEIFPFPNMKSFWGKDTIIKK